MKHSAHPQLTLAAKCQITCRMSPHVTAACHLITLKFTTLFLIHQNAFHLHNMKEDIALK